MRNTTWLVLGLGLWLCACSGNTQDSCLGIECGLQGVCDRGSCLCQPGFQPGPDGSGCLAFGHDPCEGIDCSGLGNCSLEPVGPFGLEIPVCLCEPGTVESPDRLDCLAPCAEVDCGPGACELDPAGQPGCACPPGWEPARDPLACLEKTSWAWELTYDPQGEPWVFGHAWLDVRRADQAELVEVSASYQIPISYSGNLGAALRSLARFDEQGSLVEVAQDQQAIFGSLSARRRLHVRLDSSAPAAPLARFESNISDRIWHGALAVDGPLPVPMIDGFEYPLLSYGCFDPFFFFALGRAIDPAGPPAQTVLVLAPSFALPFELEVTVNREGDRLVAALPAYGVQAEFRAGMLERVQYGWAEWLPVQATARLEINLRPLPNSPIEHLPVGLPELSEQPVELTSADGTLLAGSLAIPAGAPDPLAVLLVPGLFPTTRDNARMHSSTYRELAAWLAQGSVASLRFDARGTGQSQGETTAAPERLDEDLDAAIAWLNADPRFAGVVLVAHGFAVPPALAAAGRQPLAGLVLLAPTGADLVADIFHRTAAVWLLAGHDADTLAQWRQDFVDQMAALANGQSQEPAYGRSAAFWRAWLGRDLLDLSAVQAPTLLLGGDEDLVLPAENLRQVADALTAVGNPPLTGLLPGLAHTFTPGRIADGWEDVHLPYPFDPAAAQQILGFVAGL